jgi:hypothetical protein
MDKIVDHLFILEVMEWSKIFGNILILEPMKTVQRLHKKKTKQKERLETKQPDWKLTFNEQQEYQNRKKKSRI